MEDRAHITPRVAWSLLEETCSEWYADRAPRLGAALAFYTVFALAPGLILIIGLAALFLGKEAAQGQIVSQVQDLAGVAGAQAVQAAIESARNAGGSLLATSLGAITLLFALWGVFGELQDALNSIWGVEERAGQGMFAIIKRRLCSFTMVVGVGFLLAVSLILSAALTGFSRYLERRLDLPVDFLQVANFVVSFIVITLLFAMTYRILPDVKIDWRDVWLGSLLTALLFVIGKTLIGLYLGRTGVASAYGAAGSLVVILLWVYYSALIFFFGAEFTRVYSRQFRAARAKPEEGAVRVPEGQGGAVAQPQR